ncbi:hypothetical protein JCM8547_008438 [Rhodosporidiobolus lusitaniae]
MDGYSLKRTNTDDHYGGGSSGSGTPQPADDGGGGTGGGGGGSKKTKTGAPPLKRGSACTLCRKRKLRCDGTRPKCGTCLRLNHDCQYGDPAQEKMQEKQRELEEKCRALEAELAAYRQLGPPPVAGAPAPSAQPTPSFPSLSSNSATPGVSQAGFVSPIPLVQSHSTRTSPVAHQSSFPAPLHLSQHALNSPAYPPPTPQQPNPYPASPFGPPGAVPATYQPYPHQNEPIQPPFLQPQQPHHPLPPHQPHHPQQQQHSHLSYSPVPCPGSAASPSLVGPPSSSAYPSYPPPPGSSARRESEAFPLPPSSSSGMGGGGNVQSFPFPMSNTTPQLSDLINPPSATSLPSSGELPGGQGYASERAESEQFDGLGGGGGGGTVQGRWGKELPELEVMLDLADIYFTTLHTHLPFLHRRRFLYTLHHPSSLSSPPSLSLIFSVLALSAPYHDSPSIRSHSAIWYALAREKVELAIAAGLRPSGARVASLTVEAVQALCLLALLEMGQSDHQRAFLSIGQAVRIAAMLGLHRMDEDRVAARTGQMREKRLRPPALHMLPADGVLLEECRRTMCAVFVLDRFEAACVGWPSAISESDIRVLLPCSDALFEAGTVDPDGNDNPLWWPADGVGTSKEMGWAGIKAEEGADGQGGGGGGGEGREGMGGMERRFDEEEEGIKGGRTPSVSTFAWLCRVVWLGGRIQAETYRASGPPAGGPWNKHVDLDPLSSASDMLEMDKVLEYIRARFGALAAQRAREDKSVEGGLLMILLVTNCMFVNLFHLSASSGLSRYPWDPSAPIYIGSGEYSMRKCWEAMHSLREILSQLAVYENGRTQLHRSRATTFTAFVPYVLYCIAFPAKFGIGDWSLLVASRDRSENVHAHLARNLPSGDDAFPPAYFEERLSFVDIACNAMDRIGVVWPIGEKFATMVRGDRMRLAARTYERNAAAATASSSNGLSVSVNGNGISSLNGGHGGGSIPSDGQPQTSPLVAMNGNGVGELYGSPGEGY